MHTCSALAFGLMRSIVVIVDNTRRVREDKESVRSCDNNSDKWRVFPTIRRQSSRHLRVREL